MSGEEGIKIALLGNPNCGKTALFNALTGARQRVGNWPGVTVEKKWGKFRYADSCVKVIDLPGTYSLMSQGDDGAVDSKIAADFIVSKQVDVVVNILDASNLERNLYLTQQLSELKVPMILVVNMMDVAKNRGIKIDFKKIEALLGCPVVPTVVCKNKGIDELKDIIVNREHRPSKRIHLDVDDKIKQAHFQVTQSLVDHAVPLPEAKWQSKCFMEGDLTALNALGETEKTRVQKVVENTEAELGEELDVLIADARYQKVHEVTNQISKRVKTPRQSITQFLDRIVLNKWLGIPIFFLVMYFMFLFSVNIAGAFQDFFDIGSTTILVNGMAHWLLALNVPVWLTALVANGVGKGINTTITFIPVIGGMFLALSFLEDSGYMSRAAFVMDRFMRAMGLPGKSFMPMIVGFGCNVPAIMAARTLENKRDRILTAMMMPFMSCGARLAIFAVFVAAFFPHGGQNVIFILFVLGIVAAILTGLLLRKTVLRGEPAPLVMEMPEYHLPQFKSLMRNTGQRLKRFLKRACRVIIPVCVIIGALNSITIGGHISQTDGNKNSLLSEVGRFITPVFAPMGIKQDNWPATVGLVTGVLAKEVVVGTLNSLYSQQAGLTQKEADSFNLKAGLTAAVMSIPQNLSKIPEAFSNPIAANEAPHAMDHRVYGVMHQYFGTTLAALVYLLFVLLYFPCISTTAVMKREVGSGWTAFSMAWTTGLAYGMSVFVYQATTILEHPVASLSWMLGIVAAFVAVVVYLRNMQTGSELKSSSANLSSRA